MKALRNYDCFHVGWTSRNIVIYRYICSNSSMVCCSVLDSPWSAKNLQVWHDGKYGKCLRQLMILRNENATFANEKWESKRPKFQEDTEAI